ncbi:hypothetical protein Tco_0800950 [Tanacetum coccineum]|uniref:Transposase n=1 Tax=Tanacetum coccineum TaxID=301880 RepID=A0ABQ4ZY04_9ASTR
MARRPLGWKVVEHVSHKKFLNGGVIVVEDDPDVIHVDNSSDLALSTSLNDLEIAALHIDGQSIDVDAPPDIIDVVDEDDDIIDEEDPIPHDLADSDDEDLVNLDIDDGVNVMSADVARGHGGDGGGDDRPPPYQVPTGCGGCLGNRGKGTRKPNLGGRRAGRLHTRQETRNLGLKAITDKNGPVPIRFEFGDRETLMPLGDHAAHWANYLGELVRELPLHYPSWRQMPPERKARVVAKIGTQFDLRPHMESDRWPQIYAGIQQHLQKIYNGKKAALKERYWVPEEDGTYDVERIRRGRPSHISEVDWDAQIAFWNDPKNLARAAQNKQNRAKSKVVSMKGLNVKKHKGRGLKMVQVRKFNGVTTRKSRPGDQVFSGDICRPGNVTKRQNLSTVHFFYEVPEKALSVELLENSVEVLKILENKLESMKILENKLESLKLQENQPVDGLVPPSTKKNYIRKCFREAVKE